MEAHVKVNCRPNTVASLGRLMRLYILPELGGIRLSEVDRPHRTRAGECAPLAMATGLA